MPKVEDSLDRQEAEAIARLSALENLREQARVGNRASMLSHIEKLIQSELKGLQTRRANREESQHPEG